MPPSLRSSSSFGSAEVEVDRVGSRVDAVAFAADAEDLARGDVARDEVAVLRIAFFEEVPPLGVGDLTRRASVTLFARHPDAAAFAAGRLAHEAKLVGAGDGRRMHLDELAVGVLDAGLVGAGAGAAGADEAHGALAEDQPASAGGEHDGVGRERADLHAEHVLGDGAAADALVVDDGAEELPELVLLDEAVDFGAADRSVG